MPLRSEDLDGAAMGVCRRLACGCAKTWVKGWPGEPAVDRTLESLRRATPDCAFEPMTLDGFRALPRTCEQHRGRS